MNECIYEDGYKDIESISLWKYINDICVEEYKGGSSLA